MSRPPGFIALVSVLIMSALALLVGTGVLLRAIGESNIQISSEQAFRAHNAATYCAEYALMQLKNSTSYAGNQTVTADNGDTCYILAPGGTGSTNRTVQTTSTVSGANRKMTVTVSNVNPTMQISSWQELPDF